MAASAAPARGPIIVDCLAVTFTAAATLGILLLYGGESLINSALGSQKPLLYSTLATIFATLLGLMVATLALTVALPKTDRLLILSDAGKLPDFIRDLLATVYALAAAVPIAVIALVAEANALADQASFVLLVAAGALVLVRMSRSLSLLGRILIAGTRPW